MQMVEIAKALSLDARIIIMDEPTSSLTAGESAHLFTIIRQLKAEGIGIIYISHRMEEVLTLADRITVLRDGRYVGDLTRAEATTDKIVAMMVGRELQGQYFPPRARRRRRRRERRPRPRPPPPVLEVEDLRVPGAPAGVSFTAARGEILGFAGLVGSGRTELMETIFGVTPAASGTMLLDGQPYAAAHAARRDPARRLPGARGSQAPRPGAADVGRREHLAAQTSATTTAGAGWIARPRSASPTPRSRACAPRRRASARRS